MNTITYPEKTNAMIDRATAAGLIPGKPVAVEGRHGVISGINPLYYDVADPYIYVDFGGFEHHVMVRMSTVQLEAAA